MKSSAARIIAIDGPAASGKSSVARELARRLGFVYVNSGAMYRAVTWRALASGISPTDSREVERLLENLTLPNDDRGAPHLHDDRVNENVSAISKIGPVREIIVRQLRATAQQNDLVMEGRDIGSVVFPETPYKFYIDASPEIRAQRRAAQGLRDHIAARDQADSSRRNSPLIIAEDAHVIDSSGLTIDGVVGEIIGRLKLKGLTIAS